MMARVRSRIAVRRDAALLGSERSGVAALEFALLAPVMATLLFGMVDVTQAIIAYRKVNIVAQETAEILTELALQPNQTSFLSVSTLNQGSSQIYSVFPNLVNYTPSSPNNATYAVTVSNVAFVGTAPQGCVTGVNCSTYNANLAWSVPLARGQQITRPCGPVDQVTPATTPSTSNVPTSGMTTLQSMIVVDVVYDFTPIFGVFITGKNIPFKRSAYVSDRASISPYVTYDTPANANVCPGFN